MAINQTITQLPTPPSTTDVVNFNDRADNFLAAILTFVTQTNTAIGQINSTETNINSKESSATSAASTATTQAGIATTKASEANESATAAYNAQLAAEAVFDSFDDKYLGAKATEPTVDNDGNPLVTGALYFRTTSPKGIYVYDAELSAWSIFSYVPTSHGTLSGRSETDSHPMSAIAGLVEALADKLSKTLDASIDGVKTFLKSPKIRSSDNTHFATLSYTGTSDITFDLSNKDISYKNTPVSITSWSYSGTTITLNVTSHTFVVGDYIEVQGLTSTTYPANGVFKVTSVTSTTIVYTLGATPTGTAVVSSATVKGYATINGRVSESIGVNQTWKDVTSSRASGVTYTNTTGKPILVKIIATSGGAANFVTFVVDGVTFPQITYGVGNAPEFNILVQVDATYSATIATGFKWYELR